MFAIVQNDVGRYIHKMIQRKYFKTKFMSPNLVIVQTIDQRLHVADFEQDEEKYNIREMEVRLNGLVVVTLM